MSLTSSLQSVGKIFPKPQVLCTAKYINNHAAKVIHLGGGYTDDDIWDPHEKLKVV